MELPMVPLRLELLVGLATLSIQSVAVLSNWLEWSIAISAALRILVMPECVPTFSQKLR